MSHPTNLRKAASSKSSQLDFASQVQRFDFRGDAVDMALRKLLAKIHLPKESQQIDRAMEDFAKRYYECNPRLTDGSDAIYAVAFSILLLHTDAHNKNVRQKMSKDTFIMRTKVIEGGETVPPEILDIMFDNIVFSEFTYADGDPLQNRLAEKTSSWFSKLKNDSGASTQAANLITDLYPKLDLLMPAENTLSFKRSLQSVNFSGMHLSYLHAQRLFLAGVRSRHHSSGVSSVNSSTYAVRVWKAGILERKYDIARGGKKASTRGWRPFGVVLSGSQIIFFADMSAFQTWMQQDDALSAEESSDKSVASHRYSQSANDSQPGSPTIRPPSAFVQATYPHDLTYPPPSSPSYLSAKTRTVTSFSSIYSQQSLVSNDSNRVSTAVSVTPSAPSSPALAHPLLRPVQIISLANVVCIHDEAYTKYPHVFRLITDDGQEFMLRAESGDDMDDWMLNINYAATIKSTGIRLRSVRRPSTESRPDQRRLSDQKHREGKAKIKIDELSQNLGEQTRILDRELQLRNNLMVLVPLQKSSKDRMLVFAESIGRRIRNQHIVLQRLGCYREFLEKELKWWSSENMARKMSAPLPSLPHTSDIQRSSTTPIVLNLDPDSQIHSSFFSSPSDAVPHSSSPTKLDEEVMWNNRNDSEPAGFPKRASSLLKLTTIKSMAGTLDSPQQPLKTANDSQNSASVEESASDKETDKETTLTSTAEQHAEEDKNEWMLRRLSLRYIPPLSFSDEPEDYLQLCVNNVHASYSNNSSGGSISKHVTGPSAGQSRPHIDGHLQRSKEREWQEAPSTDTPLSPKRDDSEVAKAIRRRSQSNPIMPHHHALLRSTKGKLLDVPSEPGSTSRGRSGSEASSVRDDDDMSVIIVNEDPEDDLEESFQGWTLTPAKVFSL